MKRQIEMEEMMLRAHREFMTNLEKAVDILEHDIKETGDLSRDCTGEWCKAAESVLDDLHNSVYSISEPRFSTDQDTARLRDLRCRIRDVYAANLYGHRVTAHAA